MLVKTIWKNNLAFTGENEKGQSLAIDKETAPTPKELVLLGLAGCTAMDVISILEKMRLDVKDFRVEAETTLTEKHPKVFAAIKLHYYVKGDVSEEKFKKAIDLSKDKYCGVSAMLAKNSEISYDYTIEN